MNGAARTALAVLVLAALAAGIVSAPAARAKPNLILVTVDTLRQDHLGFAGYPRDTSPNLDALAREGADELADLTLLRGQDVPGHGGESSRRSCTRTAP